MPRCRDPLGSWSDPDDPADPVSPARIRPGTEDPDRGELLLPLHDTPALPTRQED